MLLMSLYEKPTDYECRSDLQRAYQCNRWGMEDDEAGETCVIELSGLPANNSKVSKERPEKIRRQIEVLRPTRIVRIQESILKHNPEFVVMYGLSAKEHWMSIAGVPLQAGIPKKVGPTTFLLARHPTAYYKKGQKKDQYWMELGTKLRAES